MSNRIDTKIVLGSKRYQSAIDTDISLNVPLDNTQKEIDEFDRSSVLSLAQVFDDERQESSTFRLSAKIDFLFYNAYYGTTGIGVGTDYKPFTNYLYYTNTNTSFNSNVWSGYPQYVEFDLIRNDNNVSGYTTSLGSTPPHINFVNKSASTYNWTQYVSYAYENDYEKILQYYINQTDNFIWEAGFGVPFFIQNPTIINGQSLISFICPVEHNVSVGEWIEVELEGGWNGINGVKTFQVYSLGDLGYGSEKYIVNIYNNGFTSTFFTNQKKGTLKRIIDIDNPIETKSEYYVRKHKIITNVDESILTKAGFDQNGFGVKRQYEYSALTPDNIARVTQKEGNQSYLISFSKDIDISKYRDNLNRPLSELFITILNKGYFGWMNYPLNPLFPNCPSIRMGYDFNFSYTTSPYWDITNPIAASNIKTDSYNRGSFTFYYNRDLKSGDTIDGAYCEFNKFEQKERVISEIYHKLQFNSNLFNIDTTISTTNPDGYYYNPHSSFTLRVYSDYIEEGLLKDIAGVPDYSYFSNYYKKFRWRDLYTYGFIDESGIGVDYPFINGTHYPYNNIIFRVIPEGNISINTTAIADPIIDDCE